MIKLRKNAIKYKDSSGVMQSAGAVVLRIKSSGGSSEDVKYVTFMSEDGLTELYVKPVATGDDCVDVVAKGMIDAPEKESTAQYNYNYSGWATSVGGSASADALKNVTEDRTVYAAFTSELRYYTISYYDGNSLLKSESLSYGSIPNYTPTKDDHLFTGWSPEIAMVTENVSYYAQWEESVSFAAASWDRIAEISASGEADSHFAVGDERVIDINGESVTFVIAGFNHDDLADGSGKAGISIITKNVPSIAVSSINTLYYVKPTAVDDVFMDYLPDDLVEHIKPVSKECENDYYSGTDTRQVEFNLFPLSFIEVGITTTGDPEYYNSLGTCYALYENNIVGSGKRTFRLASDDTRVNCLIRGHWRVGELANDMILTKAGTLDTSASSPYYRIFGFCI